MSSIAMLVALALVGVGIGLLSGMLGIGGGTIMVPVLRLLFGLDPVTCTATSLFTIIPTSISGAVSHLRGKTCLPALGLALGLGGACTSPVGVYLATISPGWAVMAAAAAVIAYSAVSMLRKACALPRRASDRVAGAAGRAGAQAPGASSRATGAATDGVASGEANVAAGAATEEPFALSRKNLLAGFGIGLCAGLLSGYVGVGGGFIIVPLLLSVVGLPMRKASGTSLIAVLVLAIPGAVEQALFGNIDYLAGLALAVGSIPGAVAGTRLMRRVPERGLRFLFGAVLLLAAVLLVVNELGVF